MDTAPFFEFYYKNAEVNSILILDSTGNIIDVNNAFTKNFGYTPGFIKGKNFDILYTERDKALNKPRIELNTVLSKGQSNDDNYVLDNNGKAIWCTGESVLTVGKGGEQYIVKDIVNLQSKRQLQFLLKSTEELLNRIFETSKDVPMLVLDGSLKVQKVNTAFINFFEIKDMPASGSRLSDLQNPFWKSDHIKSELRQVLVNDKPIKGKKLSIETSAGVKKNVIIDSRIIEKDAIRGRQIFIIIEEVAKPAEY